MKTNMKTVSTPALRGLRSVRTTALCAFAVLTAHAHAGLYTAVQLDNPSGLNSHAYGINASGQVRPPHSPSPIPVLTVSGAAGAKANS